jgi:hypothetical protein
VTFLCCVPSFSLRQSIFPPSCSFPPSENQNKHTFPPSRSFSLSPVTFAPRKQDRIPSSGDEHLAELKLWCLQPGRHRHLVWPPPPRRLGSPPVMMLLIGMAPSWKRSQTCLIQTPQGKLCLNGSCFPQGPGMKQHRHMASSEDLGMNSCNHASLVN